LGGIIQKFINIKSGRNKNIIEEKTFIRFQYKMTCQIITRQLCVFKQVSLPLLFYCISFIYTWMIYEINIKGQGTVKEESKRHLLKIPKLERIYLVLYKAKCLIHYKKLPVTGFSGSVLGFFDPLC